MVPAPIVSNRPAMAGSPLSLSHPPLANARPSRTCAAHRPMLAASCERVRVRVRVLASGAVMDDTFQTVVTRLRAAGCVFAEDEAELLIAEAPTPAELTAMVERRAAGIPLEYVLGWAAFCGLRISVDPGVFVPRRRTELLVREAAALTSPGMVVIDLCCGSGALGVALATLAGPVELHAADVAPVAVACARRNVAAVGGHVYEG